MRNALLATAALALVLSTSARAETAALSGLQEPDPTIAAAPEPLPPPGVAAGVTPSAAAGASLPLTATAPRDQYVVDAGARLREWYPVVDTFLDAGLPTNLAHHQVAVREAWVGARQSWDILLGATDANWDAAQRDFEAAWSRFQATWTEARRFT